MIKKLLISFPVILSIAIGSITSSCDDDIYPANYKINAWSTEPFGLRLSNDNVTVASSGDEFGLYVYHYGSWKISNYPEWIHIRTEKIDETEDCLSIVVDENNSTDARIAVIELRQDVADIHISKSLTISQAGSTPYFEVQGNDIVIDCNAQEFEIPYKTNIKDIEISSCSEFIEYVDVNKSTNSLKVKVSANLGKYAREGYIFINNPYTNGNFSVSFTQETAWKGLATAEKDAPGKGTTYIYNIEDVALMPWNASTSASWIEVTPTSGDPATRVKVIVDENTTEYSRTGYVYLRYVDNYEAIWDFAKITINQAGRILRFAEESATIESNGASVDVTLTADIEWTVSEKPEWITVTPESGDGTATIQLGAQPNESINQRSGTVSITAPNNAFSTQIYVTQKGKEFAPDKDVLNFKWSQSTQNLSLSVPGSWSAAVSDGWISLSKYTGTGDETITVTADTNTSESSREGKILIVSEGKQVSVTVRQEGQYIRISSTATHFPATESTLELIVPSTIGREASIEYPEDGPSEWLTYEALCTPPTTTIHKSADTDATEKPSNSNQVGFNIKAAANPSYKERSATFTVKPTEDGVNEVYLDGVKVILTQAGRALSASTTSVRFFSKGGTSPTYLITADGNYSITKDDGDNWYTLVHDEATNSFFIVATDNKGETERQGKLILSLLDLPEGETYDVEIPVIQLGQQGWSIDIDDNFGEDHDWSPISTTD